MFSAGPYLSVNKTWSVLLTDEKQLVPIQQSKNKYKNTCEFKIKNSPRGFRAISVIMKISGMSANKMRSAAEAATVRRLENSWFLQVL